MDLTQQRQYEAQRYFETFDVPPRYQIEDADGFEYTVGLNEYTRTVYVYDNYKEENSATTKITFTLKFKNHSAEIEEAFLGAVRLK
jgi:hypothetical protein